MKRDALPAGTVSIRPALLSVKQAALYLSCSSSFLNARRAADAAALREGRATSGPAWSKVPQGIRYSTAALDEWIARTSIAFGIDESKRHNAPEATGSETE